MVPGKKYTPDDILLILRRRFWLVLDPVCHRLGGDGGLGAAVAESSTGRKPPFSWYPRECRKASFGQRSTAGSRIGCPRFSSRS